MLVQVYQQRFDPWAVLRRRVDLWREAALVYRTAAASRAQQLVFNDLCAQHGQLKDLAAIDDLVLRELALSAAAVRGALVDDGVIELRALAQGVALMATLTAHAALAFGAQ